MEPVVLAEGFFKYIDGMDGLMLMFALFILGLGTFGFVLFIITMLLGWREKPNAPSKKDPNTDWQDESRYEPPGSWTVFILRLIAGTALLVSIIWAIAICFPAEGTPPGTVTPTPTPISKVTPTPVPPEEVITVEADGYQFDKDEITVVAGTDLVFRFINKDKDIPHNLAFYKDSRAQEKLAQTSRGATCRGPCGNEVRFRAPSRPGIHYFFCDVHPGMQGSLFVVAK